MSGFKSISPYEFEFNCCNSFKNQWALATAAKADGSLNTMTIAWGGMGVLWNKPVSFLFIRPQRYTYQFTENSDYFSIAFFGPEYRDKLQFCGTVSGRDQDKVSHCGFTTAFSDEGVPYFEEAETVLLCRKLYAQDLSEDCALSETVTNSYPNKDYHRMYVGEILDILVRQ